ncbi:hypothetical protein AVEN_65449-1 [Araneus ventricosus]|uniref:Uncharacterized protein n=1 Tax=Araneus ventricosus TaxID=182803 RepID=A0A4Y2II20_ARAVE|nr:hypothetical protein AVEN_65449-1 [Araneus ventricosus]
MGLSPHFATETRMTLSQVAEWGEIGRSVAYLQVRNTDSGNTEILFSQFVYLNDYLEKIDTNQNYEATVKLSMEEKWLKFSTDSYKVH